MREVVVVVVAVAAVDVVVVRFGESITSATKRFVTLSFSRCWHISRVEKCQ